jgi:gamma-butyrobetaine dioxygenase
MANSTMGDRSVTLDWDDGTSSDFHYIWLRDNCPCTECKHPNAWERLLDNVELDLDVRLKKISFDDVLEITWENGHETTMSADWLREHRYGRAGRDSRREIPILWTAEIATDPPSISLSEIDDDETGLQRWLTMVRDFGFTIVTDVPTRVGVWSNWPNASPTSRRPTLGVSSR